MANIATSLATSPASSLYPRAAVKLQDAVQGLGSLPRGTITEILGECSTGRTALAQTMLATATLGGEVVAWIDGGDAFDPASAVRAGADLGKLLWVQCAHRLETALKAADMVLHSGGFGLVILDLCDIPATALGRVPLSYWYRIRNAVQHTPAIVLVLAKEAVAKASSAHQFALSQSSIEWRGLAPFQTIVRMESEAVTRKPYDAVPLKLAALAEA
jgi:hypothetical protein